jgi:mRNA interferase MazF
MRRGLIILTPFPYTNLSGQKTRPALVVSRSDRSGSDVIIAFITTQSAEKATSTDLTIDTTHAEFSNTGLKRSSVVKLGKLVTVESSIVLGELGELPAALMQAADEKLRYALDL